MIAFPGPRLTAALLALALATAASGQTAPGQTGQAYDNTPSDPAATGFLRGYVDQRMLSLPTQGVQQVSGNVLVTLQSTSGAAERVAFQFSLDFTTGQTSVIPQPDAPVLDERWRMASEEAVQQVFALSSPPSAPTTDFVLKLQREENEVRVNCKPRLTTANYAMNMWFSEEGTLLRKQTMFTNPGGKSTTADAKYEHRVVGNRSVLTQETVTIDGLKKTSTFEYVQKNGILVLQRIRTDGVLSLKADNQSWMRLPVTVQVDVMADLAVAGG